MRLFALSRRRIRPLLLLLAVCGSLLCCGCRRPLSPGPSFAYADEDFSVLVTGEITRLSPDGYTGDPTLVGTSLAGVARPFAATVTVHTDPSGDRTESVTYTDPPSLAGVTLTHQTRTDGQVTLTLSRSTKDQPPLTVDLSAVPTARTASLLAPVQMLLPKGDIQTVSPTEDGCTTVTRALSNGFVTFTFQSGRDFPVSVTWETTREKGTLRLLA